MNKKVYLLRTHNPTSFVSPPTFYWKDDIYVIPPYKLSVTVAAFLIFIIFILPTSIVWYLHISKTIKMDNYVPYLITAISGFSICMTFIAYFIMYKKENYFEYDKNEKKIFLPREGLQIKIEDVICFKSVTEKIQWGGDRIFFSELQIVYFESKQKRNRAKVIFASEGDNIIIKTLKELSENIPVDVYVFDDDEDVTNKTLL